MPAIRLIICGAGILWASLPDVYENFKHLNFYNKSESSFKVPPENLCMLSHDLFKLWVSYDF
jgi:hypothetical protein